MAADWIKDLCRSNSRSDKEKVIEKALIASRLGSLSAECFLYNTYLAYHPNYRYGIKIVPETSGLLYRPNPWTKFWGVLEDLRYGVFTGNGAYNAVVHMSQEFDSEQWNWLCRRVILKDFRCGVNIKTLNKVLEHTEWRIPDPQ